MAENAVWFYGKDGKQHGPISAGELKRLTRSGQISGSELVWKKGMTDWREAASIKGLFQEPVPVPTSYSTLSPESARASPVRRLLRNPFLVAILLTCCFPIGLVLVWIHPHWTKMQKWTWTGVFAACFIGLAVLSEPSDQRAKKDLATVHQLPNDVSSSDKLTADYLLMTPGWSSTHQSQMHFRTGAIENTFREVSKSDSMIEGEWIENFPAAADFPGTSITHKYTTQIRTKRGFVECDGRGVSPSIKIKIGTSPGDTWDGSSEDARFTFIGFREIEGSGDKGPFSVRQAVIDMRREANTLKSRTEFRLERGHGVVGVKTFDSYDGQPEILVYECSLISSGQDR